MMVVNRKSIISDLVELELMGVEEGDTKLTHIPYLMKLGEWLGCSVSWARLSGTGFGGQICMWKWLWKMVIRCPRGPATWETGDVNGEVINLCPGEAVWATQMCSWLVQGSGPMICDTCSLHRNAWTQIPTWLPILFPANVHSSRQPMMVQVTGPLNPPEGPGWSACLPASALRSPSSDKHLGSEL